MYPTKSCYEKNPRGDPEFKILIFLKIVVYMVVSGLSCGIWDLSYVMRNLLLQCTDSPVVVHRLSCSVACGTLVPQTEIKLVCPVLQGRHLTSGPPEKSLKVSLEAHILTRDLEPRLYF